MMLMMIILLDPRSAYNRAFLFQSTDGSQSKRNKYIRTYLCDKVKDAVFLSDWFFSGKSSIE